MPQTLDTTSSHIILILGRPVLALPRKSECQASTILTTLVYRGPGLNSHHILFLGADKNNNTPTYTMVYTIFQAALLNSVQ